jgi:hypothetical protein
MSALIAARNLMCAASLRKDAYVDMFHVGSGDGKRNEIFRLTGSGAGMTTNASRLVDDLGPLHRPALWLFNHGIFANYWLHGQTRIGLGFGESELYHATNERKHGG